MKDLNNPFEKQAEMDRNLSGYIQKISSVFHGLLYAFWGACIGGVFGALFSGYTLVLDSSYNLISSLLPGLLIGACTGLLIYKLLSILDKLIMKKIKRLFGIEEIPWIPIILLIGLLIILVLFGAFHLFS